MPTTATVSCESSSSLAASTSSYPTSVSHNTKAKQRRNGSTVSLSELFSKDLYPFLRSNSKSRRKVSRLSPPVEELQDQKIPFPQDYAQGEHDHLDLPGTQMLRENNEKSSNRDRFYGFFGRSSSRSRSKKRRSRSADALPVITDSSLPTPSSHARHSSLGDEQNVGAKPASISPSRPLSTATNRTVTQTKFHPMKIPESVSVATPPQQSSVTLEPVKPRKKTIFGIPIPNTRKTSVSRPQTPKQHPDPRKLDRVFSTPHISVPELPMINSTNLRSTDDIPSFLAHSFDISEPDSGLGLETVGSNTKVFAPQARPAFTVAPTNLADIPHVPIRVSSSPPRIEKEKYPDPLDANPRRPKPDPSSGRSSPLVGFFKGSSSRVASPTGDSRGGRDSSASIRASISGPKMTKARNKHGSFDFERPISASVGSRQNGGRSGLNSRTPSASDMGVLALNSGNGKFSAGHWPGHSTTYVIHEERPALSRSRSSKSAKTTGGHEVGARILRFEDSPLQHTNGEFHPQVRSNTDSRSRFPLPHVSTNAKSMSPKAAAPTLPPVDTALLPTGQSSSWGRGTGMKALHSPVTALPAFSFEHATANGKSGLGRSAGRGRSLDLGIELNWAPKRVKEEAVMGGRSKWKEEAEVKELGRKRVADAFEEVLGESGFAKFREYVHRFDARLIPLEGPSGLLYKVQRLLDTTAQGLDEKAKKELLERFDRVVQHNRP